MKAIIVIIWVLLFIFSLSGLTQAEDKKRMDSNSNSDDAFVLQTGKKLIPGIHVYDADENHLGLLVDMGYDILSIYNFKVKSIFSLAPSTGNIGGGLLYFESSDCSGPPLVSAAIMYKIYRNHAKYYIGNRVKPVLKNVNSRIPPDDECTGSWQFEDYPVVQAIEVLPQELGFHPPVALPLQFKARIKLVK